ncbi:MAG: PKD domain-containing protein [Nanoarchaeota archaeon]|nr:PKD domain-containing protein [Nanoarchaeota archaeon]
MKVIKFLVLVFAVFLIGNVSASFDVGNASHSIDFKYGPEANIQGWINISAKNQASNSYIIDSLGKKIELKKLLNQNTADYDCFPEDCSPDYSAKTPATSKELNLMVTTSKTVGLVLKGDVNEINSIEFKVYSDALPSCSSQILIDLFADNTINFMNNKSTSVGCAKNSGCFDNNKATDSYKIESNMYCQKVSLNPASGYKIGAWIKKESGARNFTMELYSIDEYNYTNLENNCKIDGTSISTTGQEVSCNVDYSSPTYQEAFVCIRSSQGTGIYYIKGYGDSEGCGYFGGGTDSYDDLNAAYKIFAQGKQFASFGELYISNDFGNGESFAFLAQEYLEKRYGDLNCGNEGCIIPIKIISNYENQNTKFQEIFLSDLKLEYISTGRSFNNKEFYDLTESPAKVSFDFQKLWLDNSGFLAPSNYGDYDYSLKLGNSEICSEEITVDEVPVIQRLFPTSTVSAYPTEFEVKLDSYKNVSKYKWDFGDGETATTENKTVFHTYDEQGDYNFKITITTDEDFSTSKTFNLTVGSPEEIINITLKKYKKNLESLKDNFKDYSSFTLQELENLFGLEEVETTLNQIESDFESSNTEEEFNLILGQLLEIDLPKSISTTSESDSLIYYPQKENVDVYLIEEITETESSSDDEDTVNAIFSWNAKNIVTKIGFEKISATYSNSEEPILTVFTLNIDKKNTFNGKAYLVFNDIENLNFEKGYSQVDGGDYFYIDLENFDKSVTFSTTEDISFSDLPVFIAPEFSLLNLQISSECGDGVCDFSETKEGCPEDCKPEKDYTLYILIIVFLILLAIIVYAFMQIWYKKKYESHLFKNKNDLLNIMNYMHSSKKKGLSHSEIEKSLRKSKWRNEQVNYAMKKYSGKRTGMAELPIDRLIKKISSRKSQKDFDSGKKY